MLCHKPTYPATHPHVDPVKEPIKAPTAAAPMVTFRECFLARTCEPLQTCTFSNVSSNNSIHLFVTRLSEQSLFYEFCPLFLPNLSWLQAISILHQSTTLQREGNTHILYLHLISMLLHSPKPLHQ